MARAKAARKILALSKPLMSGVQDLPPIGFSFNE
jgi:hypothetical protein